MHELIFLKLGGSLITNKQEASIARMDVLERLAGEIKAALDAKPDIRLVLGHGSGSFGHIPAKKYGTRQGVSTPEQWLGFAKVWKEARTLNQIVIETLLAADLPVIAFPPSATVLAEDGRVLEWPLEPMTAALEAGLIPVINGDTIFDIRRGGTILSTEDLFRYLAPVLRPRRILLAGLEEGVWGDFPACTQLVPVITPDDYAQVARGLGGSAAVDVTGGMAQKVEEMLHLVQEAPGLEALIFSGQAQGAVKRALLGETLGTTIRSFHSE